MIKRSMKAKLIISYLAVALLTVLVVSIFVRVNSGQQLFNLVVDQQIADLQDEAIYYYSQTGDWGGFAAYLKQTLIQTAPPLPADQPPTGQNLPPVPFNRDFRSNNGLLDTNLTVVIPFRGYEVGQKATRDEMKGAVEVELEGETIGYIIPDRVFSFKLNAEEELFLKRTNRAIVIAAFAGVMGAVLMGFLLASLFLKPIRNLMKASRNMASGQLGQEVPVTSTDELGQLSQTFNQMSNDLAVADQQRRQMTADITHDLSTPLQVISGYMEMIEETPDALTPARVKMINIEIDHLHRLVDDLAMLSEADARELNIQNQPVETQELIKRVYHAYEPLAQKKEIHLILDLSKNISRINVDEGRMVQVLSNLLDNALRYTPVGGEIHIQAEQKGGKVYIKVKDNGSGIDPADLPYIFNRFYRADKAREGNSGKMGLGLSIARALVVAQGGEIYAEPVNDLPGATFVIRFDALDT